MTFGQLKSSYFEECDGVHNSKLWIFRDKLLLFGPPPSLDGLGGRPSAPQVTSHRGTCVGCACGCGRRNPEGLWPRAALWPRPPKRTGMWEAFCTPKTVSPATTRRLLPGRVRDKSFESMSNISDIRY